MGLENIWNSVEGTVVDENRPEDIEEGNESTEVDAGFVRFFMNQI